MLEHGGRLQRAVREFGIAREHWLDLSTGISPFGWPVGAIPDSAWRRLPEDDDGLVEIAREYCGARDVLPVAGTQAAILALPRLRGASRVGVVAPGYAEHAHAWQSAGHRVSTRAADELLRDDDCDVVVLIHPNNPTGERFEPLALLDLHARLAARGGWLVVDEAFVDATPERSLSSHADREGLIVLRSTGKFFGLAGARAGFVAASPPLLGALREALGPWTLNGPARYMLKHALADRGWHGRQRARLRDASERLRALLTRRGLPPSGSTAYFQWCRDARAAAWHRALATRGVLTRRFDEPPSVRFGLPGDDAAFARLDRALAEAAEEVAR